MVQKGEGEYAGFRSEMLGLKGSRHHRITDSYGIYDAYKTIRKGKWADIGRPLTEHEFYSIIRTMNNLMADALGRGIEIEFPCRMGSLELRKRKAGASFSKGKLKVTYSIDWDKTLKLWYEDKEAYARKTLIRIPDRSIFIVRYNKENANYDNKSFMEFSVNRGIKTRLRKNIKNNKIDAFEYGKRKSKLC